MAIRTSVWDEGERQMKQYLSATHKTRAPQRRTLVYGITTVGRHFRAFKYSDKTKHVVHRVPRGVRKKPTPFDIGDEQDRRDIAKILDHIRDNH